MKRVLCTKQLSGGWGGGNFSSQETSNEGYEEQTEQVKCVACEVS